MYLKLNESGIAQYPYTRADLCKDNPDTSFPENISDRDLVEFNTVRVVPMERPMPALFEQVVEDFPKLVEGTWTQQWRTARINEEAAANLLRTTRNQALVATDWTQLADAPLSAETKASWAAYRQALRDFSEQPGFPYAVVWPKAPA